MLFRLYGAFGALLGLSTVALSAYASHAMALASETDQRRMAIALGIQGLHALLLLIIASLLRQGGGVLLHAASGVVLVGVVLFCGSLYGAALAGWATPLAPVGGALLMLGWLLLALAMLGLRRA